MDSLSVILIIATMLLLFYLHQQSQQKEPKIEKCNCSHPDYSSSEIPMNLQNPQNPQNLQNPQNNVEEKIVYYYPQYPNPWEMNRRLYYDRFYDRAGGYDLYSYANGNRHNHNNHNNHNSQPPVSINNHNHNNINYPRNPEPFENKVESRQTEHRQTEPMSVQPMSVQPMPVQPRQAELDMPTISKNIYSGSETISKETFQYF